MISLTVKLTHPGPEELPQVADGGGGGADLSGEAVASVLQQFLTDALCVSLHDNEVFRVVIVQDEAGQIQ